MNNYSRQRELILKEIRHTRTHPTAEEIYQKVNQKDPKISKSTVYRNINILVEQKAIIKITVPEGPDRFDYLHQPHHHAICEECGKVFDFEYSFPMKKLTKTIQEQTGVIVNQDGITIHGICTQCISKQ